MAYDVTDIIKIARAFSIKIIITVFKHYNLPFIFIKMAYAVKTE